MMSSKSGRAASKREEACRGGVGKDARRMNYNNFASRITRIIKPQPAASSPAKALRPMLSTRPPAPAVSQRLVKGALATCAFLVSAATLPAASYVVDLNTPTVDKWQYPFGGAGGTRTNASTFGAVGSAGFDDRDAEFYNGFDTASTVPTGLGSSNYQILSATFTLSLGPGPNGDVPDVTFDGTYDPISTFGVSGEPINGDDAGRPFELYGVGYRGGLMNTTVVESSPFGTAGEGTRNLYPTDFVGNTSLSGSNRDVANNVTGGFDAMPFAIGQVAPGDLTNGKVDEDANIVFTLNLANPNVVRYLQESLNEGRVSFLVTSLHSAAQGGPVVYPVYYTKENLLGGDPGRLDLQVQTVPEPSAVTLSLLAFGLGVAGYRGGRVCRGKEQLS